MSFQRTTAVNKLLKLNKRKRVIPGGTWAGKTYDILAIEIDHLIKHPKEDTTVIAETIPAIKQGALKDFITIMQDTLRWQPNNFNWTDKIYTFTTVQKFNSQPLILRTKPNKQESVNVYFVMR